MPSQCVAWNCPTRRRGDSLDEQTITFHSFPLNRPTLLSQWLEQMGETTWKPQRSSVLCSKHFDKSCFLQNYVQPRLKQNAVPTFFEKRIGAAVDLDKQAQQKDERIRKQVQSENARSPRKRKAAVHDPEEEINKLREMLTDERVKRRELELEIFKLRQEKSEMSSKMVKLEQSKQRPNIPQNLIPIIVDAMAKGVDPFKVENRNAAKRPATQTPSKTPIAAKSATPSTLKATTAATATVTPQKVVVQLPGEVGKNVSFLVPVTAGAPTACAPSTSKADTPVDVE